MRARWVLRLGGLGFGYLEHRVPRAGASSGLLDCQWAHFAQASSMMPRHAAGRPGRPRVDSEAGSRQPAAPSPRFQARFLGPESHPGRRCRPAGPGRAPGAHPRAPLDSQARIFASTLRLLLVTCDAAPFRLGVKFDAHTGVTAPTPPRGAREWGHRALAREVACRWGSSIIKTAPSKKKAQDSGPSVPLRWAVERRLKTAPPACFN